MVCSITKTHEQFLQRKLTFELAPLYFLGLGWFPYSTDRLHWYIASLNSISNHAYTELHRHICAQNGLYKHRCVNTEKSVLKLSLQNTHFDLFKGVMTIYESKEFSVSILWLKWQIQNGWLGRLAKIMTRCHSGPILTRLLEYKHFHYILEWLLYGTERTLLLIHIKLSRQFLRTSKHLRGLHWDFERYMFGNPFFSLNYSEYQFDDSCKN